MCTVVCIGNMWGIGFHSVRVRWISCVKFQIWFVINYSWMISKTLEKDLSLQLAFLLIVDNNFLSIGCPLEDMSVRVSGSRLTSESCLSYQYYRNGRGYFMKNILSSLDPPGSVLPCPSTPGHLTPPPDHLCKAWSPCTVHLKSVFVSSHTDVVSVKVPEFPR